MTPQDNQALAQIIEDHQYAGVCGDEDHQAQPNRYVSCAGCSWTHDIAGTSDSRSWIRAHAEHLAEEMATALSDPLISRIHQAAEAAINSVYGTDDRHAYMGLRIAQRAVDGTPLPWKL